MIVTSWENSSSKLRDQYQYPAATGTAGVALGFICLWCKCLEQEKKVSPSFVYSELSYNLGCP